MRDSFSLDILNHLKVNGSKPWHHGQSILQFVLLKTYNFLASFVSLTLTIKLSSYGTIPLSLCLHWTSYIWNFAQCYSLYQKCSLISIQTQFKFHPFWKIFLNLFQQFFNLYEGALNVYPHFVWFFPHFTFIICLHVFLPY